MERTEHGEWVRKFEDSLKIHIRWVQVAGQKIGVDKFLLEHHDDSKLSADELYGYARHFQGDGKDPDAFATAWLHHIHNNPHHWQYWIFSDGHTPKNTSVENGVVRMPDSYVKEMIADWMGASMAYTSSWDMTDWLWSHFQKISLHSKSAITLRKELGYLGYDEVVAYAKLKNES